MANNFIVSKPFLRSAPFYYAPRPDVTTFTSGHILLMKNTARKGVPRIMKLDRNALKRLLLLSDTQLKFIIERLAAEAGVDISGMDLSPSALGELRRAVDSASDEELEKLAGELLGSIDGTNA